MPQETDSATATSVEQPDLAAAASAVETAGSVVKDAFEHLAADIDADQVVAYDFAHAAAAVENARAVLEYGENGDEEARIACAFVADAVHDVATRLMGREQEWGAELGRSTPHSPLHAPIAPRSSSRSSAGSRGRATSMTTS